MSKKAPSSSQPNPFAPLKPRKGQPPSIKYCAWEVLKEKPDGLVLSDLVKEIEERELRQFGGKKKSTQVVSGELSKQKEYFEHDKEKNLWCIVASKLGPKEIEDDAPVLTSFKTSKPPPSKSSPSPSPSPKRKLERGLSPRPKKKAKGPALIGLPVKVWWAGEKQYFPGEITSYSEEKDKYDIAYEDGDLDIDIEFRKYNIEMKGKKIEWIKVDEHNMDDSDEEGNSDKDGDGDGIKTVAAIEETAEKQPSDEGNQYFGDDKFFVNYGSN